MPARPEPARVRPSEGAAAGAGVIHDLGYRHYDGPRLGLSHVRRALYAESARGAYGLGRTGRSKVVPMLLLGAVCLPALVLSVIVSVTGAQELPLAYTSYVSRLQVLVSVYVASQAPNSVSRDLRFGVLPLYFSRPLRPVDYVLAKHAALTTAVFVLLAAPLCVLLAGALLAELPLDEQLPGFLRALGAAALLAVLLAGLGLVIASVTPRRGLGVAAIVTVLLLLPGVQSVAAAIATERGSTDAAGWLGLLSPYTLVDGVARTVLRIPGPAATEPPGTVGAVVFVLVLLSLVAGCLGLLLVRYARTWR